MLMHHPAHLHTDAQLNQLRDSNDAVSIALYCLQNSNNPETLWFQCNILEHVLVQRSSFWASLPIVVHEQVRRCHPTDRWNVRVHGIDSTTQQRPRTYCCRC